MGKQCHQADLGRRERRGVSYCPPSCIGGVPGNEGWGEVYWMDILFAHASLRERGREGLHRRGSLGLFLLFLILALACLYFSLLATGWTTEKSSKKNHFLLYGISEMTNAVFEACNIVWFQRFLICVFLPSIILTQAEGRYKEHFYS